MQEAFASGDYASLGVRMALYLPSIDKGRSRCLTERVGHLKDESFRSQYDAPGAGEFKMFRACEPAMVSRRAREYRSFEPDKTLRQCSEIRRRPSEHRKSFPISSRPQAASQAPTSAHFTICQEP
jgi:hypothetical protein